MFQMTFTMDLKKTDISQQHQENNLSCHSVEYWNLIDFLGTGEQHSSAGAVQTAQYKFSTLPEAHYATQAVLNIMFRDLGIHNSFSALSNIPSVQSIVPSQPPALSTSYSSTTPTSVAATDMSLKALFSPAKFSQLRQKVKTRKQNIVSGVNQPPVSAQSTVTSQPPALSRSYSSTIPTSVAASDLSLKALFSPAKFSQLRQKVKTRKQNIVSGVNQPPVSAHGTNPQQHPQHSTHSSVPLGLTQPTPLIPAHHIPKPITIASLKNKTVSCILPSIPSESSHSRASDALARGTKRPASTESNTSSTGEQHANKKSRPVSGALGIFLC